MQIGMVLANTGYPPDLRVEKEAARLIAAGDEVMVLCRGAGSDADEADVDGARAIRHRVHPGSLIRRKLDSFTYLLTLDSPSWRKAMERLVTEHGAQALHLHDLPYAKSVIRAARRTGVPVVLDLHENYPAALALWRRRRIDRLLFSPARAARLEKWACGAADRVVVVVEEARERLIGLGVPAEKIVVFGNSEPLALLEEGQSPSPRPEELRIVYVGGVAAHRGLDTAVAAMPAILAVNPAATLTIVGDGTTLEELRAQAHALGVDGPVRFTGRLPFDEAMQHVREATVATVPHHRSPHTDATVPHKLFQYFALGRPVIVSDCAPLARIVETEHAGEVFESGDPAGFARAALDLTDPERWQIASDAGKNAVRTRWNLETEAVALTDMYAELAHR